MVLLFCGCCMNPGTAEYICQHRILPYLSSHNQQLQDAHIQVLKQVCLLYFAGVLQVSLFRFLSELSPLCYPCISCMCTYFTMTTYRSLLHLQLYTKLSSLLCMPLQQLLLQKIVLSKKDIVQSWTPTQDPEFNNQMHQHCAEKPCS